MHGATFLQDLAVVMIVAGLVTVLFHRFKQPVVLGYILAGVIIGPHLLPTPLIHDQEAINTLAELGVVFLMFSLGLEFRIGKLKDVGTTALIAATAEILLMFLVGFEVGQLFGWSKMDSIFLGAMLSVSSTTIIVKALDELGKRKEPFAQLIFGILVVEDILGIVMIALLSGIAMTGTLQAGALIETLTRLSIFLVAALVVGILTVPRMLAYVAKFKSAEMLLVAVMGLCFGVSMLAVKLGYSVALGAFIIGAVIAESREIGKIEHLMAPIRDLFSAVFFVAIGLLIQPSMLEKYWVPIVIITFAMIVAKVLTCSFGAFIAGNDRRTSLRVGMGLAQIGEFSFIIAGLGISLKVTSDFLYPIAVTVSAITTLTTPYLIKGSDRVVNGFDRLAPRGVATSLDVYTRWVGALAASGATPSAGKFVRKWAWQIALNMLLVAAVFIAALFVRRHNPAWMERLAISQQWLDAALWAAALLFSMPLLIANYRKLQAMGMLIAETAVQKMEESPKRAAVKGIVSAVVLMGGTVLLGILLLVLSAAILPSQKIPLALLVIIGAVTAVMWRSFIHLYSKAQITIRETLEQPTPMLHKPDSSLAGFLEKAELTSAAIPAGAAAHGRLIRELQLRTETGATIIGIERAGETTVNPGPEEELLAGDRVLLVGRAEQLAKAQRFLARLATRE